MNKIERAIINQGKKVLIKHALAELDEYKQKLLKTNDTFIIDILNTGLLLDVRAAQKKAIEAIENKLHGLAKTRKKPGEGAKNAANG